MVCVDLLGGCGLFGESVPELLHLGLEAGSHLKQAHAGRRSVRRIDLQTR
jgi:hypothetical protein